MKTNLAGSGPAPIEHNIAVAATGAVKAGAGASDPNQSSSDTDMRPFQQRMVGAWSGFDGGLLLMLSGDDYTAREFLEYAGTDGAWKNAFTRPRLVRLDWKDADHTFSNVAHRVAAENQSLQWLESQANRSRNDSE